MLTPECDKMHAVRDETQAAGEFIEWLERHGYALARLSPGTRGTGEFGLAPCTERLEDLLAKWKGIDLDLVEQEKRQILADLRASHERRTA